ncbi:MAG: response regulator transcription factor [Planctomycetes bacterium]|nr:response regulator transcription factor [Planctomycetota bacterium]
MSAIRVLIVEDEDPLRMALNDALAAEGYLVEEAADGDIGCRLALENTPDVILLDLMLPGRDGYSILKEVRQARINVPIIILSARGEEWDRIQGFEFGADDYLVKPFSTKELLLRMRVALRRNGGDDSSDDVSAGKQIIGDVEVDFGGYCLVKDGQQVGLSRKEMDLLKFFLGRPGITLSRAEILDHVWGNDEFPTNRTIDTHVLKLRKKLERCPDNPKILITVHGVGYKLAPQ